MSCINQNDAGVFCHILTKVTFQPSLPTATVSGSGQ